MVCEQFDIFAGAGTDSQNRSIANARLLGQRTKIDFIGNHHSRVVNKFTGLRVRPLKRVGLEYRQNEIGIPGPIPGAVNTLQLNIILGIVQARGIRKRYWKSSKIEPDFDNVSRRARGRCGYRRVALRQAVEQA